jgi:hypothetical protein
MRAESGRDGGDGPRCAVHPSSIVRVPLIVIAVRNLESQFN